MFNYFRNLFFLYLERKATTDAYSSGRLWSPVGVISLHFDCWVRLYGGALCPSLIGHLFLFAWPCGLELALDLNLEIIFT